MVSIIITSYNKANTIERAIESALAQSYKNCEIIVVDDCSTDESREICSRFGNKIKVISTPVNSGLPYAREDGIQAAKGRFLTFLDADDFLDKTAIEHCVRCIKNTDADIIQMHIYRRVNRIDTPIKFRSKYNKSNAVNACLYNENLFPVQCWGKLYRAEFINDISPIDYSGFWGEDRLFNLPIMESKPQIVVEPKAKYNYVWGGESLSKFNINTLQEYKEVYKLKLNWAEENDYEYYITEMQTELISLLKYHIRQMINSGDYSDELAVNILKNELALPFWQEFRLNTTAEKLYFGQKHSLSRIIKKRVVQILSK